MYIGISGFVKYVAPPPHPPPPAFFPPPLPLPTFLWPKKLFKVGECVVIDGVMVVVIYS